MNPRARRIRRQRRKDRVRDAEHEAELAREELAAFNRKAQRLAAQAEKKVAQADPNHLLRVQSQIQTGAGLFARAAAALPKA